MRCERDVAGPFTLSLITVSGRFGVDHAALDLVVSLTPSGARSAGADFGRDAVSSLLGNAQVVIPHQRCSASPASHERGLFTHLTRTRVRCTLERGVKSELIGRPTIVGKAVEVKIRVEREGKFTDFLVTMRAPGLWQVVPPVADVRWVIERVLAEHHAELREKFDQIWSTAHAGPRSRPPR